MIQMYADNVLVLLDALSEGLTAGGIVTPARTPDAIEGVRGTVLAVGPGVAYPIRTHPHRRTTPCDASPRVGIGLMPMETNVGDCVLLDNPAAGDRVPVPVLVRAGLDPDRHYRIVREAEIAAIL